MLRRSPLPEEGQLQNWFAFRIGPTDTDLLCSWVHETSVAHQASYVDALRFIREKTEAEGSGFLDNILTVARTPKAERLALNELLAFSAPLLKEMRERTQKNGQRPPAEAFHELREKLREKVRAMWPDAHRAKVDGALVMASQGHSLNLEKLVRAMQAPDPLKETAHGSW